MAIDLNTVLRAVLAGGTGAAAGTIAGQQEREQRGRENLIDELRREQLTQLRTRAQQDVQDREREERAQDEARSARVGEFAALMSQLEALDPKMARRLEGVTGPEQVETVRQALSQAQRQRELQQAGDLRRDLVREPREPAERMTPEQAIALRLLEQVEGDTIEERMQNAMQAARLLTSGKTSLDAVNEESGRLGFDPISAEGQRVRLTPEQLAMALGEEPVSAAPARRADDRVVRQRSPLGLPQPGRAPRLSPQEQQQVDAVLALAEDDPTAIDRALARPDVPESVKRALREAAAGGP